MVAKQTHEAKKIEKNQLNRGCEERLEYLSILGRFCVRAGTPVEIEKCTSSKTESDTKIAELMTTAPPTKPNTNSSMHPGLMALCGHGETPEPGGLHGGHRSIFVVRICHSAAATKTMPSAAAFHSILQQLRSDDVTPFSPPQNQRAAAPSIYAAILGDRQPINDVPLHQEPWLSSLAKCLQIYIIYSHSYIKQKSH